METNNEQINYHRMHIDKLLIDKCFEEIFKGHQGNNRYLEPKEWFYKYLRSKGINTDFTIIGYNSNDGRYHKDENDLYIILDKITCYKVERNKENHLYVDKVFLNTNWVKQDKQYVYDSLKKRIHQIVMEMKYNSYNTSEYDVHHIHNTFDNRYKRMIALTKSDHRKIHASEKKEGISRKDLLNVDSIHKLVEVLR